MSSEEVELSSHNSSASTDDIDKDINAMEVDSAFKSRTARHRISKWTVVVLTYLDKGLLAIAFSLFALVVLLSYYGVILMNFVFFMAAILSYVLSPIYHGLADDWLSFTFAFLQIFLMAPVIEFFILFLLESVGSLADSIIHLAPSVRVAFDLAIHSGRTKLKRLYQSEGGADRNVFKSLALLIVSVLVLGVSLVVFVITFALPSCFPLLGIVAWLAIVLQILSLFLPSYDYWWRMLTGFRETKPAFLEEPLLDIRDGFLPELEAYLGDNADNGGQTYVSTFRGPAFGNLDLLGGEDSTDSSLSVSDDEKRNKKKRKAKPPVAIMEGTAGDWNFGEPGLKEVWQGLVPIIMAQEYFPCFDYGMALGTNRSRMNVKRSALWVSVILNLAVIVFDLYRASRKVNGYFNLSIGLRIFFFPPISYFHIGVILFERPRASLLRGLLKVFFVVAWLVVIVTLGGLMAVRVLPALTRLTDMPKASTYLNPLMPSTMKNPACTFSYGGTSIVEAIAFALGPYDIERNYTIFLNQMEFFFGSDWESWLNYSVHRLDSTTPFIVYNDTVRGLISFGFRGFVSGSELTVQVEMVASEYVLPILQNIVPFYDLFVDTWLEWWLELMQRFGILFFNPKCVAVEMVDAAQEVFDSLGLENEPVIFSGINTGGLYAKALAITNKKLGISFLSFPVYNDYFTSMFELDGDDASRIVNVHTSEGLFTFQEPQIATNVAVPWIPSPSILDGTVHDSWIRDTVYKSFCTLTQLCYDDERFAEYCLAAIGEEEVGIVEEGLEGKRW
jgi:hypothetical protein